jgi:hypothetical protein
MIRRTWSQLPDGVRSQIVRRGGQMLNESQAPAGRHSEFSATLHMEVGPVFVKGITADNPLADGHRHEANVNTWLPAVAPRLQWTIEADGWLMLGFEHLSGRHAGLAPGSADLPLVTDAVTTMAEALTPCPAPGVPKLADQWARLAAWRRLRHNPPVDLHPWSRANLDRFVYWEHRAIDVVAGSSLAHTDLHSLNLVVGRAARVVDWAWSRQAAPWLDVGFLVLRLIEAGHTPPEAERWAAELDAWSEASETARTAFAIAVLGIWEFLQRHQPLPHRERLTNAARQWAQHRCG